MRWTVDGIQYSFSRFQQGYVPDNTVLINLAAYVTYKLVPYPQSLGPRVGQQAEPGEKHQRLSDPRINRDSYRNPPVSNKIIWCSYGPSILVAFPSPLSVQLICMYTQY